MNPIRLFGYVLRGALALWLSPFLLLWHAITGESPWANLWDFIRLKGHYAP